MVTILKEVDAVVIGMGWTGSILSRELTKAGLKVVGLERGAHAHARARISPFPSIRDELKYAVRQELFQDTQHRNGHACATRDRDRAADPAARLVPAGHECRRRRLALERRDLAAAAKPTTCCARIYARDTAATRSPRT